MKATLSRALVALACLGLWPADVRAVDPIPVAPDQIRLQQVLKVNEIIGVLRRIFPNGDASDPLVTTNVTVSFASATLAEFTNRLQEVAFQTALLATNYPLANTDATNSRFYLVTTAREIGIQSIFPDIDPPGESGNHLIEMAQVGANFNLVTNGAGGVKLPDGNTQATLPITFSSYVFLSAPELRFFSSFPPASYPFWFASEQAYARIYTNNTSNVVEEASWVGLSKCFMKGDSTGNYEFAGDTSGGESGVIRMTAIGRVGIRSSFITQGQLAVLVLDTTNAVIPTIRYWLPTGQPIGAPVLASISLTNGTPRIGVAGRPSRRVVIESATSLGSTAVWNVETTLSLSDQHGLTNYLCTANLGPGTGPRRFLRLREE